MGVGNNFDRVAAITDLTPGIGYGITAPAGYIHTNPPTSWVDLMFNNPSLILVMILKVRFSVLMVVSYTCKFDWHNQIKAFNVSNAYEATTIFAVNDLDVSADFTFTTGVEMNPDGSKLFVSGGQASTYKIAEYILSTPHNLNTATKTRNLL